MQYTDSQKKVFTGTQTDIVRDALTFYINEKDYKRLNEFFIRYINKYEIDFLAPEFLPSEDKSQSWLSHAAEIKSTAHILQVLLGKNNLRKNHTNSDHLIRFLECYCNTSNISIYVVQYAIAHSTKQMPQTLIDQYKNRAKSDNRRGQQAARSMVEHNLRLQTSSDTTSQTAVMTPAATTATSTTFSVLQKITRFLPARQPSQQLPPPIPPALANYPNAPQLFQPLPPPIPPALANYLYAPQLYQPLPPPILPAFANSPYAQQPYAAYPQNPYSYQRPYAYPQHPYSYQQQYSANAQQTGHTSPISQPSPQDLQMVVESIISLQTSIKEDSASTGDTISANVNQRKRQHTSANTTSSSSAAQSSQTTAASTKKKPRLGHVT